MNDAKRQPPSVSGPVGPTISRLRQKPPLSLVMSMRKTSSFGALPSSLSMSWKLLWNHRHVAIYTRDEDVRRVTSSVYKLIVSQTLRDENTQLVVKALKLRNLVVLKYNAEREEYARFFESQTHAEIGEFKHIAEQAGVEFDSSALATIE